MGFVIACADCFEGNNDLIASKEEGKHKRKKKRIARAFGASAVSPFCVFQSVRYLLFVAGIENFRSLFSLASAAIALQRPGHSSATTGRLGKTAEPFQRQQRDSGCAPFRKGMRALSARLSTGDTVATHELWGISASGLDCTACCTPGCAAECTSAIYRRSNK